MLRILLWAGYCVAAAVASAAIGAWLLVAPVRAGAFLHDVYVIFPSPNSTRKRIVLRILGAALLSVGVYGFGVAWRALLLLR